MTTRSPEAEDTFVGKKYKYGFVTDIDADTVPPGLDEDVIRLISARKREPEFLLEWRLQAYRHWLTMKQPNWAHVKHEPIDYQAISYYAAPKAKDAPKSLDEVDPKLLAPTKSWASHCTNRRSWPAWPLMRFSTVCR